MDSSTPLSFAHLAAASVALAGLGLTMGFSPTLLELTLYTLERSSAPARGVRALCGGMLIGAVLLLVVFSTFDPDAIIAVFRGRLEAFAVDAAVDVVAGVLFVVAAALVIRVHPRPRTRRAANRLGGSRRLVIAGIVGIAVSVSGVATAYLADRTVTSSTTVIAVRAAEYLFFLAFVIGPYLLIGLVWGRAPSIERAVRAVQSRIARFDFRPVLAAALLLAGCLSLAFGLHGLLTA